MKKVAEKRDLNPRVSKPNNDVNPKSKPTKLNTPLPPGGKKKAWKNCEKKLVIVIFNIYVYNKKEVIK